MDKDDNDSDIDIKEEEIFGEDMDTEMVMDEEEEGVEEVPGNHESDYEDVEEEDDEEEEEKSQSDIADKNSTSEAKTVKRKIYLPGMRVKEGEELVCEESAYLTLHSFSTEAPCLTFDIIPDNLGSNRVKFPLTAYMVSGTQAQRSHDNHIIVMKMQNVFKTLPKSSDDELSSDESEEEGDDEARKPEFNSTKIPHHGCVNRLRFKFVGDKPLCASWSERGTVSIWDLTLPLRSLDNVQMLKDYIKMKDKDRPKPIFTFKGHKSEGYAVDWSPTCPGVLATGDCSKFIHVWKPHESTWLVDQRPFTGHTDSVEDIQWSPNEESVFATCSVDKSIRIWDTRAKSNKACIMTKDNAHESDVNVIHWNRTDPLIASGGDDAALKIWDLRSLNTGETIAEFHHHHKAPITSIEWNPNESTSLASAGEDEQISIWDLAVEKDQDEISEDDIDKIPPQLMFIHQGQQDIKELHWHKQIPGVVISTSATGFNIFKPVNA